MSNQTAIFLLDSAELKELIKQTIREVRQELPNVPENASNDFRLITRKEAAGILTISLPTLSKLIKQGAIPALRLGGKIMFKQGELISSLPYVQSLKFQRRRA